MALIGRLRDGLRDIDGVTMYCQDDLAHHIGVLAFNVAGLEAADVGMMLDVDHNIACRTGLHCAPRVHQQLGTVARHGAVRLSVGPFNTASHVETALGAVREIAAMRKPAPAHA
jgi:selenocysteine lyase/cysteine desulfurase